MNIKTRIRHIEQKIKPNACGFCACEKDPRYPRTETVYHENGKPATSSDLVNKLLPDVCGDCGKPIHKMQVIINSPILKRRNPTKIRKTAFPKNGIRRITNEY